MLESVAPRSGCVKSEVRTTELRVILVPGGTLCCLERLRENVTHRLDVCMRVCVIHMLESL